VKNCSIIDREDQSSLNYSALPDKVAEKGRHAGDECEFLFILGKPKKGGEQEKG
jgi:hypothetical protein